MTINKNFILSHIILIFKGILVGFGAIMPGISGGTLCVAFGMYHILLDALSHPFKTMREHGIRISAFVLGGVIGFIGLAGFADWLMKMNSQAVICAFVGFILGTVPELWEGAGEEGRNKNSYISMILAFIIMLCILTALRVGNAFTIAPSFLGFLFCGFVWGTSFIVPGLSSSTLLLFFGLYQPMLEGISRLSFNVLIPLAIGMIICLLLLPKAVKNMYNNGYNVLSHIVLGIVLASTASILPLDAFNNVKNATISIICIIAGAICSYLSTVACKKLEKN